MATLGAKNKSSPVVHGLGRNCQAQLIPSDGLTNSPCEPLCSSAEIEWQGTTSTLCKLSACALFRLARDASR